MIHHLSCHCGAVQIELDVTDFGAPYRCDCSLCKRKGYAMSAIPQEALTIVKGAGNLTLYQWNTNTAEHFFCKTCGIYTHHRRRVNPAEFGVNTGAIEGFDAGDPPTTDGKRLSSV